MFYWDSAGVTIVFHCLADLSILCLLCHYKSVYTFCKEQMTWHGPLGFIGLESRLGFISLEGLEHQEQVMVSM